MALVALHVALYIRARGDHRVAGLFGELQRFFGQRRSNATAPQRVGHESAIDIQGLFTEVHIGQVGTMTVHIGLELMTCLVMVDGQRLAHHYSSRVLGSDPTLHVFPAKGPSGILRKIATAAKSSQISYAAPCLVGQREEPTAPEQVGT